MVVAGCSRASGVKVEPKVSRVGTTGIGGEENKLTIVKGSHRPPDRIPFDSIIKGFGLLG